ncbi:hypothetical protein [Anaeromyxobacter diazotrophicus]|nr:hypothetical protein [Anaeromyxobacter diazotrophicus]
MSNATSAALRPDRSATCMMGATSCAASLMATCCAPQIAHSTTMVATTKPSRGLRGALMGRESYHERAGAAGARGEPPAAR